MKLELIKIIAGHVNSLQNYRTGKINYKKITFYFVLPLLFSVLMVMLFRFNYHDQEECMIIPLSIFVSLLFGLLIFMPNSSKNFSQIQKDQLKDIGYNISYGILIAISDIFFIIIIDFMQFSLSVILL